MARFIRSIGTPLCDRSFIDRAACKISAEAMAEVRRIAAMEAMPINDFRASTDYRRDLVAVLVIRALANAQAHATAKKSACGMTDVTMIVNDQTRSASVPQETALLQLLRDYFYLTGAKLARDVGNCSACTRSWMASQSMLA